MGGSGRSRKAAKARPGRAPRASARRRALCASSVAGRRGRTRRAYARWPEEASAAAKAARWAGRRGGPRRGGARGARGGGAGGAPRRGTGAPWPGRGAAAAASGWFGPCGVGGGALWISNWTVRQAANRVTVVGRVIWCRKPASDAETCTGHVHQQLTTIFTVSVFRSAKSGKNVTSDTVTYCIIFSLFAVNIILL